MFYRIVAAILVAVGLSACGTIANQAVVKHDDYTIIAQGIATASETGSEATAKVAQEACAGFGKTATFARALQGTQKNAARSETYLAYDCVGDAGSTNASKEAAWVRDSRLRGKLWSDVYSVFALTLETLKNDFYKDDCKYVVVTKVAPGLILNTFDNEGTWTESWETNRCGKPAMIGARFVFSPQKGIRAVFTPEKPV